MHKKKSLPAVKKQSQRLQITTISIHLMQKQSSSKIPEQDIELFPVWDICVIQQKLKCFKTTI